MRIVTFFVSIFAGERIADPEWWPARGGDRIHVAVVAAGRRQVPHPAPAAPDADAAHRNSFRTRLRRSGRPQDAPLLPLWRYGQHRVADGIHRNA